MNIKCPYCGTKYEYNVQVPIAKASDATSTQNTRFGEETKQNGQLAQPILSSFGTHHAIIAATVIGLTLAMCVTAYGKNYTTATARANSYRQSQPQQTPTTIEIESKQQQQKKATQGANVTELGNQIKSNLAEIAKLKAENPACVLNANRKTIRNTEMRMATKADRQYCNKKQITYVRDRFYCGACHAETEASKGACCNVSRKKGFDAWKQVRLDVEKTTKINKQIDELLEQNKELKKRISTM